MFGTKKSTMLLGAICLAAAQIGFPAETPPAAENPPKDSNAVPKPLSRPIPVSIDLGRTLFEHNCAACHGKAGCGDGVAIMALKVRPRDFVNEAIRYISTDGSPSDDDFIRTIHFGRREGQMPAFPYLMDEQIRSLALYIRELNRAGAAARLKAKKPDLDEKTIDRVTRRQTAPGKPVSWQAPSAEFKADTAKGRTLFGANCAQCHGPEGHGDSQTRLLDSEGRPIKARDLTTGDFRGGSEPLDLFFRVRCGVPGTPMPAAAALSDDDVWQLVNYAKHLAHK